MRASAVILGHLDQREHLLVELFRNIRTIHLQIKVLQWHLILPDH
ncbi:MAG: hypothetical protein ACK55Z_30450 [bacterium]